MKRLLLILIVLPLLATSCYDEPYADASITPNPAYVGETINFLNLSQNTGDVEWDLGDGGTSSSNNLDYFYYDPGTYNVKLKAYGDKNYVDFATFPVEVIGSELTVVVRLWTDIDAGEAPGYLLPNARVRLYPTLTDWNEETNMAVEGFSNSVGEVTFDNLSYQRYYVDVWEANHDNYTLAGEDVGFIETAELEGIYYWTFDALVDYYPNGKKSATSRERPTDMLEKSATPGRTPGDLMDKSLREER